MSFKMSDRRKVRVTCTCTRFAHPIYQNLLPLRCISVMVLFPEIHPFSISERTTIEAMGYAIEGFSAGESLEAFLPGFIANFNLLNLLVLSSSSLLPRITWPIQQIAPVIAAPAKRSRFHFEIPPRLRTIW